MLRNDKRIPKRTEKLIWQEASSRCSFCNEDNVNLLDIHHIVPRAAGGSNESSNLILLCKNCHARVESGVISSDDVARKKQRLKIIPLFPRSGAAQSNNLLVEGDVTSSIVGNSVTIINTRKRLPPVAPTTGSIGADLDKKNYVNHLIARYHQFRKADQSYGENEPYKYAVLPASIKRKFKARTADIPVSRFQDVASFIQGKIDGTIAGQAQSEEWNQELQ